jgi:hypothetical protein
MMRFFAGISPHQLLAPGISLGDLKREQQMNIDAAGSHT